MGPGDSGSSIILAHNTREEVSLVYQTVFGTKPCLRSPSSEDSMSGAESAGTVADTGERDVGAESTAEGGTWSGYLAGGVTASSCGSASGTPSPSTTEATQRSTGSAKRVTWADQLGHSSLALAPNVRPRIPNGAPSSDPGSAATPSTVSPLWLGSSRIPLPPSTSSHVSKAPPRRAPWQATPAFSVVKSPLKSPADAVVLGSSLYSSPSRAGKAGTPPASLRPALGSRGWMAGLVKRLSSGGSSSSSSDKKENTLTYGTPPEPQGGLVRSCSAPAQRRSPGDTPQRVPCLPWDTVTVSDAPQRASSLPHPNTRWGTVAVSTSSQEASNSMPPRLDHPVYNPRYTNAILAEHQPRGSPWARGDLQPRPWAERESPGRARILRVSSAGHLEHSAAATAAVAAATAAGIKAPGIGTADRPPAAEAPGIVTPGTPAGLFRADSYQGHPVWKGAQAGLLSPQGGASPARQYRCQRPDAPIVLGGTPGTYATAPRTPPRSFPRGPRPALEALLEADPPSSAEFSPPGDFLSVTYSYSGSSNSNSTGNSTSNSTSNGNSNIETAVSVSSANPYLGGRSRPGVGRYRAPVPKDSPPAPQKPVSRGAKGTAGALCGELSPAPGAGGVARPGLGPRLRAEEGAGGAAKPGLDGVPSEVHDQTWQSTGGVQVSLSWAHTGNKSHGGTSQQGPRLQTHPLPQPRPQPQSYPQLQPHTQPQSHQQPQFHSQPHPVLVLGLTPQPIFTAPSACTMLAQGGPDSLRGSSDRDSDRAPRDAARADAKPQPRPQSQSQSQSPSQPLIRPHDRSQAPESVFQVRKELRTTRPLLAPGAGEAWGLPLPPHASRAPPLRALQSREGLLRTLLTASHGHTHPGQEGSQEASFRALLDLVGLGFIVVSLGPLRLEECSQLFARRLGVHPGQAVGMPLNSLLAPWQIGLPQCPERGKGAQAGRYVGGYSDTGSSCSDNHATGMPDIWSEGVAEGLRALLAASRDGLQGEVHFVSHSSGDYVPTLLTLKQPPSAPSHGLAHIACGIVEFL